jgi:hypothetical protein
MKIGINIYKLLYPTDEEFQKIGKQKLLIIWKKVATN